MGGASIIIQTRTRLDSGRILIGRWSVPVQLFLQYRDREYFEIFLATLSTLELLVLDVQPRGEDHAG